MSVNIDVNSNTMIVEITGLWTKSMSHEIRKQAINVLTKTKINQILLDIRKTLIEGSTMDFFEISASVVKAFPLGIKHAVVYSFDTFSKSDMEFAENVALNEGAIIKSFTNIHDACEWLYVKTIA